MKKLSNTEAEFKKALHIKKARIWEMRYEMRNSLWEYSFVSIQGDKADYES